MFVNMSDTVQHSCYEYFGLDELQIQEVEDVVASMDIPQLVGQLFIAYMMPDEYTVEQQIQTYAERLQTEVEKYHLGGYYLNRYYTPTTIHLIQMLQDQSRIPMFISADMENGAGSGFGGVIADGLSTFPALMGIGATGSPQYSYQMGFWTATQARLIGVNYIFSPSLDLNNNPENPIINVRSFGEDPGQVGMLGDAYIQGIQDGLAVPCAKHFPGHGNTSEDSHIKLCRIDQSREDLMNTELVPFQRAIDRTRIESIMTAHISVPSIEKDVSVPSTLSYNILTGLLRQDMNFEGVIITDAMLMGGITTLYSPGEAAVLSIKAGADIILMPPDLDAAYSGLLQAIENKEISEERLKESVKRVIALKAAYSILEPVFEVGADIPKQLVRKADEISFNMSCDAVTLVKNDNYCLPISPMDEPGIIYLQDKRSADQLGNDYLQEQVIVVSPDPDKETLEKIEFTLQESDVIILMADIQVLPDKDSVQVPPAHESLIHQAIKLDKPVILVSFGNPYLLNSYEGVDSYLCVYRVSEQMFDGVMEVIYGERIPHGRLPVSISEEYPVGHGLSL